MGKSVIIFGVNGTGKSTTTNILKSLSGNIKVARGSDLLMSKLFNISLNQVKSLSRQEREIFYRKMEVMSADVKKQVYIDSVLSFFADFHRNEDFRVLETHLVAYSPQNGFEIMWDPVLDSVVDYGFMLDADVELILARRTQDKSRERVLEEEVIKEHYSMNKEVFEVIVCGKKEVINIDRIPEEIAVEVHDIITETRNEIIYR